MKLFYAVDKDNIGMTSSQPGRTAGLLELPMVHLGVAWMFTSFYHDSVIFWTCTVIQQM